VISLPFSVVRPTSEYDVYHSKQKSAEIIARIRKHLVKFYEDNGLSVLYDLVMLYVSNTVSQGFPS
jgi:hypothetical protein